MSRRTLRTYGNLKDRMEKLEITLLKIRGDVVEVAKRLANGDCSKTVEDVKNQYIKEVVSLGFSSLEIDETIKDVLSNIQR